MKKILILITVIICTYSCKYEMEDLEKSIKSNKHSKSIKILNKNPELANQNKQLLALAIKQQRINYTDNSVIEKILLNTDSFYLEDSDYDYLLRSENFYLMGIIFNSGVNPFDIIVRKKSLPYYLSSYDIKSFKILFNNNHIDIRKYDEFFVHMIRDSKYQLVKFLIEKGANCNPDLTKSELKRSPLEIALKNNSKPIIKLLLDNIKDYSTLSNIWPHLAIYNKKVDLSFAENLWDIGIRDPDGLSEALFNAAQYRDIEYLIWLLDKGADPDITKEHYDEEVGPGYVAWFNVKMDWDENSDREEMYNQVDEIYRILDKYSKK